MCAPSPPAPPDFAAAARAQGDANIGASVTSGILSNPNVITPYGSQFVQGSPGETTRRTFATVGTGGTGAPAQTLPSNQPAATVDGQPIFRPTVTQILSPEQQKLYESQTGLSQGLLNTAQTGLNRVDTVMGSPFDTSGMTDVSNLNTQGLPPTSGLDIGALPETSRLGAQGLPGVNGLDIGALPQTSQLSAQGLPGVEGLNLGALPETSQLTAQGLPAQFPLSSQGLSGLGEVDLNALSQRQTSPTVGGLKDISDAMVGLYEPDIARRQEQTLNDLLIQGQSVQGPARQAADQGFADERNRLRLSALLNAGNEQSRLFGMESGLRGQQLNEQLAALGIGASNRGQLFGERGAISDDASSRRAQEFGERAQVSGASEAQRAQRLAEQLAQFGTQSSLRGQEFGERGAVSSASEAQRAQRFAEQQGLFGAESALRGQMFGERGVVTGAEEAQRAQRLAEQQAQAGFGELQRGARLGEQQAQLAGDTAQRQRQIQEAAYLRQLPLTEINALRSGNQPMLPQFQGYQGQPVAPPPVFAGAQAQGQAAQNLYGQQVAGNNALLSGLFGLGGTALGGPFGGALGSKIFG